MATIQLPFEQSVSGKVVMAAVLTGTLSKLVGMAVVSRRQRQQLLDASSFELVGKVSDLLIYPVKACRGFHTEDAQCTDVGLEKDGLVDRHWMLFGADEKQFNMRLDRRLTLVQTHSIGDVMRLTAPGMEPLDLPKYPDLTGNNVLERKVAEQPIQVLDCGVEANEWFRKYLQTQVHLVFSCPELSVRKVDKTPRNWDNTVRKGDKTIFGYLTSYLLVTTASMRYINDRLANPVEVDNFRPNIVVDSSISFDEDTWDEIKIGDDLLFHSVEPCRRCIIPTIDPVTAEKDKDMQPLKLLKSFRCRPPYGETPLFGIYVSNDSTGRISVGDPVYAKRKLSASH